MGKYGSGDRTSLRGDGLLIIRGCDAASSLLLPSLSPLHPFHGDRLAIPRRTEGHMHWADFSDDPNPEQPGPLSRL